jgi:mRNA interferase RelE/StbE
LAWTIEWSKDAVKQLKKLDKKLQDAVAKYIKKRLSETGDPRQFGKPLAYDKHGLWRYRVGKVGIICTIDDDEVKILVVRIGQRKNIYEF